jgi:nucleoside-diphosphate-sugar epimerase
LRQKINKMNNRPIKILVIGACGQIGTEVTIALRLKYGMTSVIAADVHELDELLLKHGPYACLNVLSKADVHALVIREKVNEIYHFAATLSASGEKQPKQAWELNMQGLLHVLDIAKTEKNIRVFWPSSIAIFGGPAAKAVCFQQEATEPTTVYGISKLAGELWCKYYHEQYGVDVRSIRYPGLISHSAMPGGGTTDYAVEIFHDAIRQRQYTCYLKAHTMLPMMYMPDAVKATLQLMDAPTASIKVRTSYNIAGLSFSPKELEETIKAHLPVFKVDYRPDFRQRIAESWPASIEDRQARYDWGWDPEYDLKKMVNDMLYHLQQDLVNKHS